MSRENPIWGAPRIQAELRLLGHDLAESTVAKHIDRQRKLPSPSWRAFLKSHMSELAAMDFLVVPTVTFRLLYVFVVLRHDRRRVVHFNTTTNPTAAWVAQQLKEAFPFATAPKYLLRDRDGIYGDAVRHALKSSNIAEVVTSPRSPWQNAYVERLIGSVRHECLDHCIILNDRQLRRLLSGYFDYYHHARTHRSLGQNAPEERAVESPARGKVIAEPMVGGLHHRYRRAA